MDLADQIDDYICSFEGIGDLSMDSLAMFIFIWAVLALFLVWLCKFLYHKYVTKENAGAGSASNSRQNSLAPGAAGKNANEKLRLSEPREILASKSEIKDIAAKPINGGRGRSAAIPAGGTALRKRVVRQSSTGPESRKKRYVPPPSNVVGPETTSVTWTSQVFRWLYSDLVIVNELLCSWVLALNDTLKKSLEERGVAVEVVRVLPDSPPPGLNNIFCNCDENNPSDMLITFDCDAMPVLQVKTFRQKSGKLDTSHYKVTVSRFRARMATAMNYNSLKGAMRVDGYPDVRIAMNSVGAIKPLDQDEQQLQEMISEILTNALRETVYPVDFSVYSTCPRAEIDPLELSHNMDGYNTGLSSSSEPMISGRRLLVKIVKGEGLQNAVDPFVVVEMDEPAQKNQTGARQGDNPYWDEHFLFELAPQSAEILFEVYDRPANPADAPKFLGLGLVGIDELAVGPASTQVLTLQPRPYETQPVAGAITVDFVFIEGAEIPAGPRPYKLKEALRISTPMINEHIKNGADLADAAVRALQDGALTTNGNPSKSTLIIHSVQRVELNKDGQIEVKESPDAVSGSVFTLESSVHEMSTGSINANTTAEIEQIQQDNSLITDLTASPTDSCPLAAEEEELPTISLSKGMAKVEEYAKTPTTATIPEVFGQPEATSSPNASFNSNNNNTSYQQAGQNGHQMTNNGSGNMIMHSYSDNTNSLPRNGRPPTGPGDLNLSSSPELALDDRGRSKKRNFFGTLKKRLSRSKTRTHSADRGALTPYNNNGTTPAGTLNGDPRSLSVDRAVLSKSNSLESSAISGFSSASNKTYIHEASTLVLETIENGIKRHFIVPLAIAQRPRWRRKGTKLHIYNDHTFIAKHLSGSGLICSICTKSIPRRPGKQGYECRDCQMICHKQCHIRAPQSCPNPTVLSMELSKLNSAAADRSIRKL